MKDPKKYIQGIKDRYFRITSAYPNGIVSHHGDCNIYSSEYVHCSCGLLYDLSYIYFPEAIYPNFLSEKLLVDNYGKEVKVNQKQIEKIQKLIYSVFSNSERKLKPEEIEELEIIKELFN